MKWEGDWELIEGIAFAMSISAGFIHQRVSSLIHWQLMNSIKDCNGCIALFEIDWIVSNDTVLKPDIIVICGTPEGDYIKEPPEIIFEVISPQTILKDKRVKYEIYEKKGVKFYVVVDPGYETKGAIVYRYNEGRYEKLGDFVKETVEFDIGRCKFSFDFSTIW